MSSRHLKKVFGESQLEELSKAGSKHGTTDEEEDVLPTSFNRMSKFCTNPYELLDIDGVEDTTEKELDLVPEHNADETEEGSANKLNKSTPKKKKKKKKNKNNSNTSKAQNVKDVEEEQHLESVRQIVRKVENDFLNVNETKTKRSESVDLLAINEKHTNPEYELKRIFGSKTINQELGETRQERRQKKSSRIFGRLIRQRSKWPPLSNSGLSMIDIQNRDESKKDADTFKYKFVHDKEYKDVQQIFFKAVNSHNPDNIVSVMRKNPFHVDTLLVLSDLSKHSEDLPMAAELIETAIHAMEVSTHPNFSILNPKCRLEYKYQENRAFHILLFKHLTFVGQRACYRTALELCKVLVNLDPSDPLCSTLMLDFYAVKSGELFWFINLYKMWNPERKLDQLPNWAFSVALAKFLLSRADNSAENPNKSSSSKKSESSTSLTKDQKKQFAEESDELLQHCLLMFPLVLVPLLDKCGLACNARIKNHFYFNHGAQKSTSDSLRLLCSLYVWRSYHLWRTNVAILEWIERNANIILERIDRKDPTTQSYESLRNLRYRSGTTPRNILRHAYLTDDKDFNLYIPTELSAESILNYDPFPPIDSVDIYFPEQSTYQEDREATQTMLGLFWQSLGLNYVPRGAGAPDAGRRGREAILPQEDDNDDEEREGAVGGTALHRSVATFVGAMRNLLAVATNVGDPQPPIVVEDGSDEDEEDIDGET